MGVAQWGDPREHHPRFHAGVLPVAAHQLTILVDEPAFVEESTTKLADLFDARACRALASTVSSSCLRATSAESQSEHGTGNLAHGRHRLSECHASGAVGTTVPWSCCPLP